MLGVTITFFIFILRSN